MAGRNNKYLGKEGTKVIIKLDTKFNEIIETDILNSISEALNSLNYNTRTFDSRYRESILERKASQMKETINSYIDWHVERSADAMIPIKSRNSSQCPEPKKESNQLT